MFRFVVALLLVVRVYILSDVCTFFVQFGAELTKWCPIFN